MHKSVMIKEVIKYLDIKQDGLYIDLTYGIGGHSNEILKYLNKYGNLISMDKDIISKLILKKNIKNNIIFKNSFDRINEKLCLNKNVDGIIVDLGLSLNQIKDTIMGFTFECNSQLDMRLDKKQNLKAIDWINFAKESDLNKFFNFFFEERKSKILVNNIIKTRKIFKIKTSKNLCNIIEKSLKKNNVKNKSKIFTLIKILINNELFSLNKLLEHISKLIKKNGILILISFNSLEDKIVKNYILKKKYFKQIISKPNINETNKNFLSRSAIMRIFKKTI